MTAKSVQVVTTVFRSLGKFFAALLILFWGAFFVEHLVGWFIRPAAGLPPLWVWVAQGLHFLIIVGLGLTIWRERLGTLITILATVVFFSSIGIHRFPVIALLNLLPAACFAVTWCLRPDTKKSLSAILMI